MQAHRPPPSSIWTLVVPVFLLGAIGCAEPAADQPAAYVNVRDSAGIQIVENGPLASADTLGIVVDSAARLRIGQVDGDLPHVFTWIRGVTRLGDGRFAIADWGSSDIRFFDGGGTFLTAVGREGQGPGEYVEISGLLPMPADSLLVLDRTGWRWNLIDADGTHAASVSAARYGSPGPGSTARPAVEVHAAYADGSLLVSEDLSECVTRGRDGTFCADSVRLARISREGKLLADFGPVAGRAAYFGRAGGRQQPAVDLFYGQGRWAVSGMRTWIGQGDRLDLRVYGPDGALERIVRVAEPPLPLGAESNPLHVDPEATYADARTRRAFREWQAVLREAPKPDGFPVFDDMVSDALGNVWIRMSVQAAHRLGGVNVWAVIDSTGVLRHLVRTPFLRSRSLATNMPPPEIGVDYILTIARDSFNVQVVDVHPVVRREGG